MRTCRMLGLLAMFALLATSIASGQDTTYGAAVTLSEVTSFSRVQERPSNYEGQTIRVDGVVDAVGMKSGCWLALSGGGGSDYSLYVFVRLDPCTTVFPKNTVRRKVSVQGVLQPIRLDPDPAVTDAATEFGQVESGGTLPLWELKATGVVVH